MDLIERQIKDAFENRLSSPPSGGASWTQLEGRIVSAYRRRMMTLTALVLVAAASIAVAVPKMMGANEAEPITSFNVREIGRSSFTRIQPRPTSDLVRSSNGFAITFGSTDAQGMVATIVPDDQVGTPELSDDIMAVPDANGVASDVERGVTFFFGSAVVMIGEDGTVRGTVDVELDAAEVDPATGTLFGIERIDARSARLVAVDPQSKAVRTRSKAFPAAKKVSLAIAGNRIYVASEGLPSVLETTTELSSETREIKTGTGATAIASDPATGRVAVLRPGSDGSHVDIIGPDRTVRSVVVGADANGLVFDGSDRVLTVVGKTLVGVDAGRGLVTKEQDLFAGTPTQGARLAYDVNTNRVGVLLPFPAGQPLLIVYEL